VIDHLVDIARLILRDDDGAQDAVHEALVSAWLDIRGLRDPDRFGAWLHRLLVRACYRVAKGERGRRLVEVAPVSPARARPATGLG
jgi:DNA-directed RNA polymerase specialized sigma24 family protein